MTKSTTSAPARGAVRQAERTLAPDLARGCMLLLIVLSNTAFHLWVGERGADGGHPVDGSTADRVAQFAMIVGLDLRIYPLFAFLFGYGMTQLYLRQIEAGTSERAAVRLLRRRGLWLLALGLTHAVLLMAGDIIGFYGLLSVLLGWIFLRRRDRVLVRGCWVGLALLLLWLLPLVWAVVQDGLGAAGTTAGGAGYEGYGAHQDSWFAAAGTRAYTTSIVALAGPPLVLIGGGFAVFVLGMLAARHRVLEQPARHLTLLRRTAVVGVAIGWLGALPFALAHLGVLDVPAVVVGEEGLFAALRDVTGNAAGIGYVAAFALLAHQLTRARVQRHRAYVLVRAVTAVGKRSLSCYLAHSLLFAPLLAAWGLGLGEHLGSASMALFAVAVWLVTVAGAYALERRGQRGPVETLLRRLTYGRPGKPPAWKPGDGGAASN